MARLLHTADLHLDTPFTGSGLEREQAMQRRADLLATFRQITELARQRQVDMLLIAGDLFEEDYVGAATLSRVFSALAELDPLPVLVSPGNHDPLHPASPYVTEELPPNLFLFREDRLESFEFPELGVAVHGLAFRARHEKRELLRGLRLEGELAVNILLCHGAVYEGEPGLAADYNPVRPDDLRGCGADYCALGHYHRAIEVRRDERGLRAAYCGSPEPLRYGQTGDKVGGALIIDIDTESRRLADEMVVVRRRSYHDLEVDLSGCREQADADSRIAAALADRSLAGGLVDLVATGTVPAGLILNPIDFADAAAHLFAMRLRDRTRPDYDLEALAAEETARGAFCRLLLRRLEKAEEGTEEKEIAERALWLGLAAFDGQDVEEFPS